MMSLTEAFTYFQPSRDDQSIVYLGQLFGSMTAPATGQGLLPGGSVTILSVMFETFNTLILSIGALIIVYMTVMGVMMSAHEGEFMKKWNSLWAPIRAVLGIAVLFPTSTGYSAIQIMMMWVILQGIGAADTMWSNALRFKDALGSVTAQITPPEAGAKNGMRMLFKALMCEQTALVFDEFPVETERDIGYYYCEGGKQGWCATALMKIAHPMFSLDSPTTGYQTFGPEGSCGKMHFCSQDELCKSDRPVVKEGEYDACKVCKAQTEGLKNAIFSLRSLAATLVDYDRNYTIWYYKGFRDISKQNHDYDKYLLPAVTEYCAKNKIGWASCRGKVDFNYEEETQKEQDKESKSDRQERLERKGNLPDPRAGQGSGSSAEMAEVIVPYYYKDAIKNHEDPITLAAKKYFAEIDAAMPVKIEGTGKGQLFSGKDIRNKIRATPPTGKLLEAENKGWILAGAYYYYLAQNTSDKVSQSMPTLEVVALNPASAGEDSGQPETMKTYRNNYAAAGAVLSALAGNPAGEMGGANMEVAGEANEAIASAFETAVDPDSNVNPLVKLSAVGVSLLIAAQVLFALFMLLTFILGMVSGINAFVLGTGATSPTATAMPMVWMVMVPMIGGLLGIMVSMGATLAVYLPLIPYTIFLFGAIGWLTSVVEAMVAGPLVALGILAPGGQHELLGKAEPALMLLFNIFLRPTLMVFGVIAALLLSCSVVQMINTVWNSTVYEGIVGMGPIKGEAAKFNPLMYIFFLMAYVGLIVAALNKCFAVIHILPERVMRWIGGQGEQYGEGEQVGEMKRGVEGTAASAGSAMKDSQSTVKGAGETGTKNRQNFEKEKAKPEGDAKVDGGGENKS